MNFRRLALSVSALVLALALNVSGRGAEPAPGQPLEPVAAIFKAFADHPIVALGEWHGNVQTHEFRVALLRDPRFVETVDDVVVEFGNSLYQPLIDRYVAGGDVPEVELKKTWQNTGMPHAGWDVPVYEDVYRTIRSINQGRPATKQIHVLLGDPPIDWEKVRSRRDLAEYGAQRDAFPAQLIEREVLRRGRKALLLYGTWHVSHKRYVLADGTVRTPLLALLDAAGAKTFSIDLGVNVVQGMEQIDSRVSAWPVPSLVLLHGTVFGAQPNVRPGTGGGAAPMQAHYDAMIYLGPRSAMKQSTLSPDLVADPEYLHMRMQREIRSLMSP